MIEIDNIIKNLLEDWIRANLESLFQSITLTVGKAGGELALSPAQWNPTIWDYVLRLNQEAILPIASIVLSFALVAELYQLLIDKNNQKMPTILDVMRVIVKIALAYWLVRNLFTMLLGVFDVTAFAIGKATGIVSVDGSIAVQNIDLIMENLGEVTVGAFLQIWFMTLIAQMIMWVMNIAIMLILYGRMIEIYLYCSVAAIPAAAMSSKEIDITKNFFKSICAIGLQGFLMMFCLGIYSALISSLIVTTDLSQTIFDILVCGLVLVYSLFKCSGWSKSIMNTH